MSQPQEVQQLKEQPLGQRLETLLVGTQGRGGSHPTFAKPAPLFQPCGLAMPVPIWKIQEDGGQVHDIPETSWSSNPPGWGQEVMAGPRGQGLNEHGLYGQPGGNSKLFFTSCVLG